MARNKSVAAPMSSCHLRPGVGVGTMPAMLRRVQRRLYEIVEVGAPDDTPSRVFDTLILLLIAANVVAVIVETVEPIHRAHRMFFRGFEVISVAIFTAEYLIRLWTAPVSSRFEGAVRGRLRWMGSPMALVDLAAILPFYIPLTMGMDLRFMRVLRLFRMFRLLKLVRYSRSLRALGTVVRHQKEQLVVALTFSIVLLVFASSLLYFVENETQPEAFSSIPAAMWWGVATLTTVGYGDVYPVTALGRFFGAVIAVVGVGLFALPAGILASGFTEHIEEERHASELARTCPHCGKRLE